MDQDSRRMQQAPGRRGMRTRQMAALFYVKRRQSRHRDSMTSYQKDSLNGCVFT